MGRTHVAYAFGLAVMVLPIAAIVFLPAWTLHYWQAWALLATVFGSYSVAIIASAVRREPAPLQPRKPEGPRVETPRVETPRIEPPASQRITMILASLGFVALLVVPGFDHRFGWSSVPPSISLAADLLVAAGLLITYQVRQEIVRHSYATDDEPPDRRMISTGPYAVVRHPTHAGTLLYQAAIPVALGSWWGLVVFAVITPLTLIRIFYEENLIRQIVSDYSDYTQQVKYRLLPHIW
ncbi:methyltransferase family protein [Nocardia suismassiliense]|uniref:methyltransferase family protein n=1 Tax=Nocardia suismassiliense TaxID=2077092 RepID=UPI00131F0E6C|nr:isoprenylcysteine carboxylmethyltransferase family protein [Nocardia suismassiliense]